MMSRLAVKLPSKLERLAKAQAREDGVTVQELVETAVAEKIAGARAVHQQGKFRHKVSRKRLLELLEKAPDSPPVPGDELPPDLAAKFKRNPTR
jgi:hypothetical protein